MSDLGNPKPADVPQAPELPAAGHEEAVPVLEGRLPTAAEAALLEYGKQLMLKSVETALDFHKTMLGISATFGTLVTSVTPVLVWGDKDAKLPMPEGWLLIIPPIVMLLSAVVFAVGYYPRHATLNVNVVDDIRRVREEVIGFRKLLAGVGLGLFAAALLLTVALTIGSCLSSGGKAEAHHPSA